MTSTEPANAPASEASAPAASPEYEFAPGENLVIGDCGNRARIFGILCSVTGAVQILAALVAVAGLVPRNVALFLAPSGLFNFVLGIFLTRAGTALTNVVNTQGRDVTLLLRALTAFSKAFMVQIVAAFVFLLCVAVTMGFLALTSGALLTRIAG
jgi:hypothetical protein